MKANSIIAIDLGGTNLKAALLNLKYKIIDKKIFKTGNFINPPRRNPRGFSPGMTNTRNFLEKEGASDFSPRGSTYYEIYKKWIIFISWVLWVRVRA